MYIILTLYKFYFIKNYKANGKIKQMEK